MLASGAVELRNAVTASYGLDLPATVTFDYPSVSALAGYIATRLDPVLADTLGHPVSSPVPDVHTAAIAAQPSMTVIAGLSSSVAASGQGDRGQFTAICLVFLEQSEV